MSNNSIISVLFEEIKSRMTSIENKINKISNANRTEKTETTLPAIPREVDYSRIEQIIRGCKINPVCKFKIYNIETYGRKKKGITRIPCDA
jgi:hypothetical protein